MAESGGDAKRAKPDPDAAVAPEPAPEEDSDDQLAMRELQSIQDELEKVNDKASDEVLAVEQKYNRLRRPLFVQRNAVCARIPQFWRQALLGHPVLRSAFSEDDMDVLCYCTGVDVEDFEDIKSGFKVTLSFDEPNNPYFSNRSLSKSLKFSEDATLLAQGTSIQWREGREPAEEPAVGSKRSNAGCVYSFFTQWLGANDTYHDAGQDDIANYIKDDIWPDPFRYYLASDESDEMEGEEYEGAFEGDPGQDEYEEQAGDDGGGDGDDGYDDDDYAQQRQQQQLGEQQEGQQHEGLDQEYDHDDDEGGDDADDDDRAGDDDEQQEGQQQEEAGHQQQQLGQQGGTNAAAKGSGGGG